MITEEVAINCPFKFLDPYEKNDANIFFGRDDEVEKLYRYVNKNRIVLIYGQSGAGKTSLVQCGLANRFDATDWVPLYIRRGDNINHSLLEIIEHSKALGGQTDDAKEIDRVTKSLEKISKRYLRPVYLVFDQFEELLILGDDEEKSQFLETLHSIVFSEYTQCCNLMFILREEYFAWLAPFENQIHGFSDNRLRVETMRPNKVAEVILSSCEQFNIELEHPRENVQYIIELLSTKNGISLPYLQVYLDQLWREDFKRTYPDGWTGDGLPRLEFQSNEIKDFGKITDVLERFLTERRKAIQLQLKKKWPAIDEKIVYQVLDCFVTDEGTKMPISYKLKRDVILLNNVVTKNLQEISPHVLTYIFHELEKSRLIRTDGEMYELAHDTLAALIEEHRSDHQRRLHEVRRLIRTNYQVFSRTSEFLTSKQIMMCEDVVPHLSLEVELYNFFQNSKQFREEEAEQQLKEVKDKAEREMRILEEKAEVLKRSAVTQKRLLIIMSLLFLVAVGFIWRNVEADEELRTKEEQLTLAKFDSKLQEGKRMVLDSLLQDQEAKRVILQINPLLEDYRTVKIDGNSVDGSHILQAILKILNDYPNNNILRQKRDSIHKLRFPES